MEQDHSGPAPGELELVRQLINTIDFEEEREQLGSPEQLLDWLSAHGLAGGDSCVDGRDLRKALELREALRELAAANGGAALSADTVAALNLVAAGAPLGVRLERDGTGRLEPVEQGFAGAIARILALVHAAMLDGTWPRFKICHNDSCRWAFYDRSRNGSGTWCSMRVCGNRLKARAYRRRKETIHEGRVPTPVGEDARRSVRLRLVGSGSVMCTLSRTRTRQAASHTYKQRRATVLLF